MDKRTDAKNIAVITGASSGLGREFCRQIDALGYDEIWAVARRRDRLEALQQGLKTAVRAVPLDLTDKAAIGSYAALLEAEKPNVALLINAAGFGKIGSYRDITQQDCDNMIELNCRAAVDMTQVSIPYMRAGGHIIEICSTAAFQPFQYLNIYAATKAFLLRYSRALRVELLKEGIIVTAVCPYWVGDTEFIGTAKKTTDSAYIHGYPLAGKMRNVVGLALHDSRMGRAVSTPSAVSSAHRFFSKIFPDNVLMAIWEGIRRL
ncbi:MAG: SDR family NAD(P)-dependent oxidoreductase [Lachnospiraceae bacterium]|nr:SDR family NAD(P)-dependent oxidoreductase [Lachnospiraceae bacterium]